MKPSIGRIVIFRSEDHNGVLEHPAIITRVWNDTCVNLLVFFDAGTASPRTSVTLNHETYGWKWPERV